MRGGNIVRSFPPDLLTWYLKVLRSTIKNTSYSFENKEYFSACGSLASSEEGRFFQRTLALTENCKTNLGENCSRGKWAETLFQSDLMDRPQSHIQEDPNPIVYAHRLQYCGHVNDLLNGKHVHHQMIETGHDKNKHLGSLVVQMYIHCAALEDAGVWFAKMNERNVFSWNLIMGVFVQYENGDRCLNLFFQMQHEGVMPNKVTYVNVLSTCASQVAIAAGVQIHAQIERSPIEADVVVATALVNMYNKCGSLENAQRMFDKTFHRDIVLWNAIIAAYAQHGHGKEALELCCRMQEEGTFPDKVTFVSILSTCSTFVSPVEGKQIHVYIRSCGLELDLEIANALVSMYSKFGSLESAQKIFDYMHKPDVVSWNATVAMHGKHGFCKEAFHLWNQMQQEAVMPDKVTFLTMISICTSRLFLGEGKQIHAAIMRRNVAMDVTMENALISMHGKCGNPKDAEKIFDDMPKFDVVSWNAMIAVYAQCGHYEAAVQLFDQMRTEGIIPDRVTTITVLTAIAAQAAISKGKQIHSSIVNSAFESDVVILNVLVNFYGKSGSLQDAQRIFDNISERDLASWNVMIAVHAQHGHGKEALRLFHEMKREGMLADKITFVTIIDVYAHERALIEGKRMHTHLMDNGVELDVVIATALVNMYAKCSDLERAKSVFDKIPFRNVISWNAMLSAFGQHGHFSQALQFFHQMQCEGVKPDKISCVSVLSVCSSHASLEEGKRLHACIISNEFEPSDAILNALVSMYGKCGSIEDAQRVFDKISNRDLVSWNAMIAAVAQCGLGKEALQLFNEMEGVGVIPDRVTLICVFSACSHAGMLDKCFNSLTSIKGNSVFTLTADHYDCMIDQFGRAGILDKAEELISLMPFQPTIISWMTLLGACRNQLDVKRAELVSRHMFELDPENSNLYVLLANIYTTDGILGQAEIGSSQRDEQ